MLMMGFFVILWVLKPCRVPIRPTRKWPSRPMNGSKPSVKSAGDLAGCRIRPATIRSRAAIRRQARNGEGEKGKLERKTDGAEGTDPEVTSIRQGKQATVGGRMLFDKGDASFNAEIRRQLDQVAQEIRGHRNIVLIKGHTSTDDLPDTATAQQKMDLSLRRAQAVADYLIAKGVEPEILRVQGCSNFEPVLQRAYQAVHSPTTAASRSKRPRRSLRISRIRPIARTERPPTADKLTQILPACRSGKSALPTGQESSPASSRDFLFQTPHLFSGSGPERAV